MATYIKALNNKKVLLVHILNNEPQCPQFQPQVTHFMLGENGVVCLSAAVPLTTAGYHWIRSCCAVSYCIHLTDYLICNAPAGKANPKCTIPDEYM